MVRIVGWNWAKGAFSTLFVWIRASCKDYEGLVSVGSCIYKSCIEPRGWRYILEGKVMALPVGW